MENSDEHIRSVIKQPLFFIEYLFSISVIGLSFQKLIN